MDPEIIKKFRAMLTGVSEAADTSVKRFEDLTRTAEEGLKGIQEEANSLAAEMQLLADEGKATTESYKKLARQQRELTEAKQELMGVEKEIQALQSADLSYNQKKAANIDLLIKKQKLLGQVTGEYNEEVIAGLEAQKKLTGDVASVTDELFGALGVGTKLSDTMVGRLQQGAGKLKDTFGRLGDPDDGLLGGIIETFTKGNFKVLAMNAAATAGLQIFAAYAAAVFKIAMEIDGLAASLAASTGAGRKHQQLLVDTRYELLGVGLGAEQASEAIGSLANRMSGFNRIQESTQRDLSETVGMLTALGVSADASTDITNMLTKSMGVAADDVTGNLQRIAMMGTEIGAGPAEIMRDYQEAMPYLVQFGSRAEEVFRGMKAMSEATGVSMGTLMSISKKTDTFEGAADMASQMNALMGMNLSTTELLMATSDERLEMLKREFDATGRSFSQMGRFEQQALATAAGFSSVDEAMRFFESSPAEIAANEAAMASATVNQEAFDAAVRDAIPIMTQLINAFKTLFVGVKPLLKVMVSVTRYISGFSDENKKMIGVVGFATAAFAGLFGAIATVVTVLSAKLILIAIAVTAAIGAMVMVVYKAYEAFQEAGGGIKGLFVGLYRIMFPALLIIDLFEWIGKKMGFVSEESSIVNDVLGVLGETVGLVVDALVWLAKSPVGDFFIWLGKMAITPAMLVLKALGFILGKVGKGLQWVTGGISAMREMLNKKSSPSIFEQFERMPGLFGGMKSGLQGMASLFQSIAAAISGMAASVRELFVGSFTKVIRLAAYAIGGAEAVGLVENGPGGVSAAAGNRTTAIANTTNINNVNGNSSDMQATINLTVDLGKNRVFHDAVMTVLHAEARN